MTTQNKLSDRSKQVLGFIQRYQELHGYAPTIREIGKAMGITSTSLVVYNLNLLVKAGKLERSSYRTARAIRVIGDDGVLPIYREYADLNDSHVRVSDELRALQAALKPFIALWERAAIGHEDNAIFAVGKAVNGASIGATVTYGQLRRLLALVKGK